MAYFKWRGIDLNGTICSGKTFARSKKDLSNILLEKEISILSCSPSSPWIFVRSVSLSDKIHFFRQLAVLIDSGVMLPEALQILSGLVSSMRLREIITGIKSDVHEGIPLSSALKRYPKIFDPLMIRMTHIGQETGQLGDALEQLSDYLDITQSFQKKLKSAALLPSLTFGFFMFIATAILVLIVPRFENIFTSMKKELPSVTKFIIKISSIVRNSTSIFIMIGFAFVFLGIWRYIKSTRGKETFDKFILKTSWCGQLIKNSSLVYFLHSTAMLLNSGIRLVKAMSISKKTIKNSILQSYVSQLEKNVTEGTALSQSMKMAPGNFFETDLVALVRVGEESGRLGPMLKRSAAIYQGKVNQSIRFFTTIFQPLLMIVLGLLITLLIFAIYLPVFSLANVA